jgi:nitrite reductase (NO-forming)
MLTRRILTLALIALAVFAVTRAGSDARGANDKPEAKASAGSTAAPTAVASAGGKAFDAGTPHELTTLAATTPEFEEFLRSLPPKASLPVIKGEKTVAPAVPAAITRSQNAIVEYELTVKETSATIAPNLKYTSLWTFDGVAPGPVMRVKVGDVIRFTLRNDKTSVTNHNIDFHFISGACGGCCDTQVKPGESRTIDVRALYPGCFMYHCAYSQESNIPAVHIANGMFGFLIVDPQTPLPAVAHEFMLVESEFYVEKLGQTTGGCSYNDLVAENPTHYFFNGKHAELNAPIKIGVNERVRLYVGRGGVNGTSAFHVIGAIFDKVYPDAGLLNAPVSRGVQTVTIPVGGASIVEFVSPVPGTLTAVDHNLSRVFFKGLAQVFQVEGKPNAELYESSGVPCHDAQTTQAEAKR